MHSSIDDAAAPFFFAPEHGRRYRNSDPLMIGWFDQAGGNEARRGVPFVPQRALFDRIGIRRQVLETDPYGTFC